MALVERGGHVRAFHIKRADAETVTKIVRTSISRESKLVTDESKPYTKVGAEFASHRRVTHSAGEYVRKGDREIHTNTIEGFFSASKRGMRGNHQHRDEQHLHRHAGEFELRYNNRAALGIDDVGRMNRALKGTGGKRLTYRQPDHASNA